MSMSRSTAAHRSWRRWRCGVERIQELARSDGATLADPATVERGRALWAIVAFQSVMQRPSAPHSLP